ncbi:MAG: ABC transporter ATP-binding protein [Alphaproteobacteria bacterium]
MSVLKISKLHKSFGGVNAVRNVSFEVGAEEMLALIGPNGAGKTTCFNLINGQLKPDRGSIQFLDRRLVGMQPREMWRIGISRTFQITATFASLTVLENVQLVLMSRRGEANSVVRQGGKLHSDESMAVLERIGIADQANRVCGELAYGDLKRVELAQALASEPKLLLMDEPTAGMAPKERAQLMALTADLVRERKISVLFTEHDMDAVFGHADRIVVMSRGEIVMQGPPAAVRNDPMVREIYLGRATIESKSSRKLGVL